MRRSEQHGYPQLVRRPAPWLVRIGAVCLAAALAGGLAGCSTTGGGTETPVATLDSDQRAEAERLYQELRLEYSLRNDDRTLELASELLNGYPDYDGNDAALQMAIGSAERLGSTDRALRLVDLFLREFGDSPLVGEVMQEGVDLALAAGDTAVAAQRLVSLYDQHANVALDGQVRDELDGLMPLLDTEERETLFAANRQSDLWTYLGYHTVAAAVATGRPAAAERAVAAMRSDGKQDRWLDASLEMLATGSPPANYIVVGEPVIAADLIGVLCPTTGRFAQLGNAFFDGAQLAADHVNREYGSQFRLEIEDSAADVVVAALAARQLCGSAGCIALIGGLMSAPTAAAAVVADANGVPLVSPTATHDRIWELGAGIFQTNQTEEYAQEALDLITVRIESELAKYK